MNFFKNKFAKMKTKQPTPRELSEINKTYQVLCAQTGEVQHQINLKKKELSNLLTALENVNAEANARQKLDAEKASTSDTPAKEVTAEVVNDEVTSG